MELVFASNNKHKLDEVKSALGTRFNVVSLSDIGCCGDIPEDHDTLEGNALQKARYIYEKYGKDCFSDDTGLEIEALDGRPGVYSARYAGEHCSFDDNMQKVLSELDGISNRKACFRTVIALILNGKEYVFEGKVSGKILTEKHGEKGFGYDPVFQPDGYTLSFAEMPLEEKNKISHRGRSIEKLSDFLANDPPPLAPPKGGKYFPENDFPKKEGNGFSKKEENCFSKKEENDFSQKEENCPYPKGKNYSPPLGGRGGCIIGSGNVAWHLTKQLFACGYTINCVFSRNLDNAQLLAEQVNAESVDKIEMIPPSDWYLFSIKDDAYQEIIDAFPKTTAICIHTSGSLDMHILGKLSDNYGVLYPFQTLTKGNRIPFQKIPLCIEASNEFTLNSLSKMAISLESPCYTINSQQRAYLHLCGVFASNFTNAMYGIAEQIAKQQQIDFEIIKPLITETARKIETLSPAAAQTGPAIRNDQTIIQKHIGLLTHSKWKEVYQLVSDMIIT